jgi:hypothetical protein
MTAAWPQCQHRWAGQSLGDDGRLALKSAPMVRTLLLDGRLASKSAPMGRTVLHDGRLASESALPWSGQSFMTAAWPQSQHPYGQDSPS